jgi:large subunit ribosomal protein L22
VPESSARLRYLLTSPPKVRQVLGLIRGLDVDDARDTLERCERGPAEPVMKLLDSAVSNAEHNQNIPADELFVDRAWVDEGPTLKRWRPRARGRGTRIRKRTSHMTIVVARFEDEELERRRAREAIEGPARRRPPRKRGLSAQVEAEHGELDHDHDHDDDEGVSIVEEEEAPRKRAPAKKTPAKKTPAKKAVKKAKKAAKPAKKTTKKSGGSGERSEPEASDPKKGT